MVKSETAALGERLKHELREYIVVAAYLYVCFVAIVVFKAAILAEAGVSYIPFGFAAAKALILGKFMLLGQAARLGNGHGQQSIAMVVIYKAVLFAGLLVVLTVVEEVVVGLIDREAVEASLSAHMGKKLPETLATCLLMFLILIPYIGFQEIRQALGREALAKLLFSRRTDTESAQP